MQIDTKLADKTTALQSQVPSESQASSSLPHPFPKPSSRNSSFDPKKAPISPSQVDTLPKIRQDLAEAQRSRGLLETKLQSSSEELQKLKIQSSLDHRRISELSRERDGLLRSVKDRDEEIKGKAKLLEDVHDETVSLTLQLNMADERARKLEKENQDLVQRWMKRMGEEADQMNEKSRFS